MKEIAYHFRIQVKGLDGKITYEDHIINESHTKFGSALALGKVCRLYEKLKEDRKIKDYRIL